MNPNEGIELLKFYREEEQATAEKLLIETKFIRKEIKALKAQRDFHALVYAEEAKKSKVKHYLIACDHVEILNNLINQLGGK